MSRVRRLSTREGAEYEQRDKGNHRNAGGRAGGPGSRPGRRRARHPDPDGARAAGPEWGESGGTTNGSPDAPGAVALATRTPTELGQRVPKWGESGGTTNGFDWGDAAVGAAMMVGLGVVGFGGLVLVNRRRQMEHGSDSRLASA